MKMKIGDTVQIIGGSGLDSEQVVTIVDWPRDLQPMISRTKEHAVRFANGDVRSMFRDRLAAHPPGWSPDMVADFYGFIRVKDKGEEFYGFARSG